MCSTEFEHCTWFGSEVRRTRKQRQCDECGRQILVGEKYQRSTWKGDGFQVGEACEHCTAAGTWLLAHCGYEMSGGLHDELLEHVGEGYTEDRLGRLVVGMRRKWQRFDRTGLMPVPPMIPRPKYDVALRNESMNGFGEF
jgi:hypothetical protein